MYRFPYQYQKLNSYFSPSFYLKINTFVSHSAFRHYKIVTISCQPQFSIALMSFVYWELQFEQCWTHKGKWLLCTRPCH